MNFVFLVISEQTLDMRFPALAATVSPCQYTMVPLQGLALGRPCPLDPHLTSAHTVYAPKGEYIPNGKYTTQHLPGHRVSFHFDLSCFMMFSTVINFLAC